VATYLYSADVCFTMIKQKR